MASNSKQHCTLRKQLWGVALALAVVNCGGSEAAFNDTALVSGQSNASADGLAQQCDLSGAWALRLEVPVSWPRNIGVQAGSGNVVQYARSVRKVDGNMLVDTLQICGIDIPDYRSQAMFGNELYGIRFGDDLFDSGSLPPSEVRTSVSGFSAGSTWQSEPAAIQLGVSMNDPVTAAWPRKFSDLHSMVTDADGDGHPGLTLTVDTRSGYSYPPTGMTRSATKRAHHFYAAVRNVAVISGTLDHCDVIKGRADIPTIGGRAALNSHVLGCGKIDGTDCAPAEIDLLDGLQPVYTTQPGTVVMRKIPDNATCADVRNLEF